MTGLGLIVGHLVGDYIIQNDWMAANKTNPHPGPAPRSQFVDIPPGTAPTTAMVQQIDTVFNDLRKYEEWLPGWKAWRRGNHACTLHCVLYTLAVWAFSWWWMPWWGLLVCFLVHWPLDRFKLAAWWMKNVSGQKLFASPEHPLYPWSVVVVDNTFHLLTLFLIALAAGAP